MNSIITLTSQQWKSQRQAHLQRVRPWVVDRTQRSQHGVKHPVYDFLFEYYSFRPAHFARWSPGINVVCEQWDGGEWKQWATQIEQGIVFRVESFPEKWRKHWQWGLQFLETTSQREPGFGCFGLHEWAMVYKANEIRHSKVPLRLPISDLNKVVESLPLRCTHFDAFRFFTPEAIPLNRKPLTRLTQIDDDQPGCIHANMDLYKLAFRISPFVPSELVADCFDLAIAAREVDMRASPYDLRAMGFEPILIETREGREMYAHEQRRIAQMGQPIRLRLLAEYRKLTKNKLTESLNS